MSAVAVAKTAMAPAAGLRAAHQAYNPGPEYTDAVRAAGAAIVNSGRFRTGVDCGGNPVLIVPECGTDAAADAAAAAATTYMVSACPARCRCAGFRSCGACEHVIAAMIVRASCADGNGNGNGGDGIDGTETCGSPGGRCGA